MSFRLVPNSVTLDDLERRNSPNYTPQRNSTEFGSFRDALRKVVEDILTLSAA